MAVLYDCRIGDEPSLGWGQLSGEVRSLS